MTGCNGHGAAGTCIECELPQRSRNNYFTGKLLVERDFVDEQSYFVGKDRRHNQRLHGSGTVCGLRVKQHPNPACRDRLVVIEPGTAIDCCGREILVTREEVFDFSARIHEVWDATHDPGTPMEGGHAFQVCVRYTECPTEEVPALFDECGCDDVACRPNRILESYAFDVVLDPPAAVADPPGVSLAWDNTLNVARASRVAVDPAKDRLYLVAGDPSVLYVYSTPNQVLQHSQALPAPGLDVAVNADGSRVYVAVSQTDAVLVLDADDLKTTVNTLPLASAPTGVVRLAPSHGDGRLYVLDAGAEQVVTWDATIDQAGADLAAARLGTASTGAGSAPSAVVVTRDGADVFVADPGDSTITVIEAADPGTGTQHAVPGAPSALALADTADGKRLYVADHDGGAFRVLGIDLGGVDPFPQVGADLALPAAPVGLVASAGGTWAYLLLEGPSGEGTVQAVNASVVASGGPGALAASVPIGDGPAAAALSEDGLRLYAAFSGDPADADTGGVAVVGVTEQGCKDMFDTALGPCPTCGGDDCVVLATVEDYASGDDVTDDDLDNLRDRHLLPSTELITEVIQCLLDQPAGKQGPTGDTGPKGDPGLGIDDVEATIVACDQPGHAEIQTIGTTRTLVLEIPRGCDGKDGEAPPPTTYTHICAINWEHGGVMTQGGVTDVQTRGLLIAFDANVRNVDIHDESLILLRTLDHSGHERCWCEVVPKFVGGANLDLSEDADSDTCTIDDDLGSPNEGEDVLVNGARFVPSEFSVEHRYRVVLKGDFIRDEKGLAVDADHLPPWLLNHGTGDGVEGGTFESWFRIELG